MTQPEFDPTRSASIRAMLSDTAREGAPRAATSKRRRTVLVTSIATVAVLALAGGGLAYALRPAGTGEKGPSAGTAPTATHAPAPSVTPDPGSTTPPGDVEQAGPTSTPVPVVNDPADPSTWVISFDGIGPVKLHAQMQAAIDSQSAYTAEDIPGNGMTPGTCQAYSLSAAGRPGLTLLQYADDTDVTTIAIGGNKPGGPTTDRGIGAQSTVAEMKAAYPEAELLGDPPTADSPASDYAFRQWRVTDGNGRYIVFESDDTGTDLFEIDVTDTGYAIYSPCTD